MPPSSSLTGLSPQRVLRFIFLVLSTVSLLLQLGLATVASAALPSSSPMTTRQFTVSTSLHTPSLQSFTLSYSYNSNTNINEPTSSSSSASSSSSISESSARDLLATAYLPLFIGTIDGFSTASVSSSTDPLMLAAGSADTFLGSALEGASSSSLSNSSVTIRVDASDECANVSSTNTDGFVRSPTNAFLGQSLASLAGYAASAVGATNPPVVCLGSIPSSSSASIGAPIFSVSVADGSAPLHVASAATVAAAVSGGGGGLIDGVTSAEMANVLPARMQQALGITIDSSAAAALPIASPLALLAQGLTGTPSSALLNSIGRSDGASAIVDPYGEGTLRAVASINRHSRGFLAAQLTRSYVETPSASSASAPPTLSLPALDVIETLLMNSVRSSNSAASSPSSSFPPPFSLLETVGHHSVFIPLESSPTPSSAVTTQAIADLVKSFSSGLYIDGPSSTLAYVFAGRQNTGGDAVTEDGDASYSEVEEGGRTAAVKGIRLEALVWSIEQHLAHQDSLRLVPASPTPLTAFSVITHRSHTYNLRRNLGINGDRLSAVFDAEVVGMCGRNPFKSTVRPAALEALAAKFTDSASPMTITEIISDDADRPAVASIAVAVREVDVTPSSTPSTTSVISLSFRAGPPLTPQALGQLIPVYPFNEDDGTSTQEALFALCIIFFVVMVAGTFFSFGLGWRQFLNGNRSSVGVGSMDAGNITVGAINPTAAIPTQTARVDPISRRVLASASSSSSLSSAAAGPGGGSEAYWARRKPFLPSRLGAFTTLCIVMMWAVQLQGIYYITIWPDSSASVGGGGGISSGDGSAALGLSASLFNSEGRFESFGRWVQYASLAFFPIPTQYATPLEVVAFNLWAIVVASFACCALMWAALWRDLGTTRRRMCLQYVNSLTAKEYFIRRMVDRQIYDEHCLLGGHQHSHHNNQQHQHPDKHLQQPRPFAVLTNVLADMEGELSRLEQGRAALSIRSKETFLGEDFVGDNAFIVDLGTVVDVDAGGAADGGGEGGGGGGLSPHMIAAQRRAAAKEASARQELLSAISIALTFAKRQDALEAAEEEEEERRRNLQSDGDGDGNGQHTNRRATSSKQSSRAGLSSSPARSSSGGTTKGLGVDGSAGEGRLNGVGLATRAFMRHATTGKVYECVIKGIYRKKRGGGGVNSPSATKKSSGNGGGGKALAPSSSSLWVFIEVLHLHAKAVAVFRADLAVFDMPFEHKPRPILRSQSVVGVGMPSHAASLTSPPAMALPGGANMNSSTVVAIAATSNTKGLRDAVAASTTFIDGAYFKHGNLLASPSRPRRVVKLCLGTLLTLVTAWLIIPSFWWSVHILFTAHGADRTRVHDNVLTCAWAVETGLHSLMVAAAALMTVLWVSFFVSVLLWAVYRRRVMQQWADDGATLGLKPRRFDNGGSSNGPSAAAGASGGISPVNRQTVDAPSAAAADVDVEMRATSNEPNYSDWYASRGGSGNPLLPGPNAKRAQAVGGSASDDLVVQSATGSPLATPSAVDAAAAAAGSSGSSAFAAAADASSPVAARPPMPMVGFALNGAGEGPSSAALFHPSPAARTSFGWFANSRTSFFASRATNATVTSLFGSGAPNPSFPPLLLRRRMLPTKEVSVLCDLLSALYITSKRRGAHQHHQQQHGGDAALLLSSSLPLPLPPPPLTYTALSIVNQREVMSTSLGKSTAAAALAPSGGSNRKANGGGPASTSRRQSSAAFFFGDNNNSNSNGSVPTNPLELLMAYGDPLAAGGGGSSAMNTPSSVGAMGGGGLLLAPHHAMPGDALTEEGVDMDGEGDGGVGVTNTSFSMPMGGHAGARFPLRNVIISGANGGGGVGGGLASAMSPSLSPRSRSISPSAALHLQQQQQYSAVAMLGAGGQLFAPFNGSGGGGGPTTSIITTSSISKAGAHTNSKEAVGAAGGTATVPPPPRRKSETIAPISAVPGDGDGDAVSDDGDNNNGTTIVVPIAGIGLEADGALAVSQQQSSPRGTIRRKSNKGRVNGGEEGEEDALENSLNAAGVVSQRGSVAVAGNGNGNSVVVGQLSPLLIQQRNLNQNQQQQQFSSASSWGITPTTAAILAAAVGSSRSGGEGGTTPPSAAHNGLISPTSGLPLYVSAANGAHIVRPLLVVIPPIASILFQVMDSDERIDDDEEEEEAGGGWVSFIQSGSGGGGASSPLEQQQPQPHPQQPRYPLDLVRDAVVTINLLPVTALEVAGEGGGIRPVTAAVGLQLLPSPPQPLPHEHQQPQPQHAVGRSAWAGKQSALRILLDDATTPTIVGGNDDDKATPTAAPGKGRGGDGGGDDDDDKNQSATATSRDSAAAGSKATHLNARRSVVVISPMTRQRHVLGPSSRTNGTTGEEDGGGVEMSAFENPLNINSNTNANNGNASEADASGSRRPTHTTANSSSKKSSGEGSVLYSTDTHLPPPPVSAHNPLASAPPPSASLLTPPQQGPTAEGQRESSVAVTDLLTDEDGGGGAANANAKTSSTFGALNSHSDTDNNSQSNDAPPAIPIMGSVSDHHHRTMMASTINKNPFLAPSADVKEATMLSPPAAGSDGNEGVPHAHHHVGVVFPSPPTMAMRRRFLPIRRVRADLIDKPYFEHFAHLLLSLPAVSLPLLSSYFVVTIVCMCLSVMLPSVGGVYAHRWLSGPNRFSDNLGLEGRWLSSGIDDVSSITIVVGMNAAIQYTVMGLLLGCYLMLRRGGGGGSHDGGVARGAEEDLDIIAAQQHAAAVDEANGGGDLPSSSSSSSSLRRGETHAQLTRLLLMSIVTFAAFAFVQSLNLFLGLETARERTHGAARTVIGMGLASFEASVGVCWCVTVLLFIIIMFLSTIA